MCWAVFPHLYRFSDDGGAAEMTVVKIISMVQLQMLESIVWAILSLRSLQRKKSCFLAVFVMMSYLQ